MGTPEFAVASLSALVQNGYNVIAVITAPDKPAGRGMQLQQSAVKKYATEQNIPVIQPEKLKNTEFIETLKQLNADLQIVVAFRMLPEMVWNMPPLGTLNVHGSLLPQYRGAAPINWAVINGEKYTGVTTFKLKHQIDTGDILLADSFEILYTDTAGTVHDKMKDIGAQLLLKTLAGIEDGTIIEKPQLFNNDLKHAPKITSETCKINWAETAEDIYNKIRGLSPYPTANTFLNGKLLKIFIADKEITNHNDEIETILSDNKTFLKFACTDGYIHIKELQLEGKKRMMVEDFLRGNKVD